MYEENSCIRLSSDLFWDYEEIEYYEEVGHEIISYEEALLKESKEEPKESLEPTKLSDFLKENNCYEEFINNFDKDYRYEDWKRDIDCSIYASFVWASSEDDFYFWNNINDKWVKLVNKENDLRDFFEDKIESKSLTKDDMLSVEEYIKNRREIKSKEQSKETSEEVPPLDKDEAKLLVEFLQNKINLTKETYERDINRYTSLMNKYQNILKGDL